MSGWDLPFSEPFSHNGRNSRQRSRSPRRDLRFTELSSLSWNMPDKWQSHNDDDHVFAGEGGQPSFHQFNYHHGNHYGMEQHRQSPFYYDPQYPEQYDSMMYGMDSDSPPGYRRSPDYRQGPGYRRGPGYRWSPDYRRGPGYRRSPDYRQGHSYRQYHDSSHPVSLTQSTTQSSSTNTTTIVSECINNNVLVKVCNICGKHLEPNSIDGHISTDRHQSWLQIFTKQFPDTTALTDDIYSDVKMSQNEMETIMKLEENPCGYHCDVCDITLRNYAIYREHVIGRKHTKMLHKNESDEDNTTKHHCDICDVDIQGDRSLKAHLDGVKHRKNVTRKQVNDSTTLKQSFNCEICNVHCSSQIDYNTHLNGKAHKKKNKIITNDNTTD